MPSILHKTQVHHMSPPEGALLKNRESRSLCLLSLRAALLSASRSYDVVSENMVGKACLSRASPPGDGEVWPQVGDRPVLQTTQAAAAVAAGAAGVDPAAAAAVAMVGDQAQAEGQPHGTQVHAVACAHWAGSGGQDALKEVSGVPLGVALFPEEEAGQKWVDGLGVVLEALAAVILRVGGAVWAVVRVVLHASESSWASDVQMLLPRPRLASS